MMKMSLVSFAAIKRILNNAGAQKISRESKNLFRDVIELYANEIALEAVKLCHYAGRKIISEEDIRSAVKIIGMGGEGGVENHG